MAIANIDEVCSKTYAETCIDIDDCQGDPCGLNHRDGMFASSNHTCVDGIDSYECLCASGYRNDTPKCSEAWERFPYDHVMNVLRNGNGTNLNGTTGWRTQNLQNGTTGWNHGSSNHSPDA